MARRSEPTSPWPAPATAADTDFTRLVPRRRKGVHGVEIDDESVLYDERDGRLHLLNWSASAVWWSIDGVTTVDDLTADLAARFHADDAAMRSDVVTLLGVLGAEQLVVAARSPAAAKGTHG